MQICQTALIKLSCYFVKYGTGARRHGFCTIFL